MNNQQNKEVLEVIKKIEDFLFRQTDPLTESNDKIRSRYNQNSDECLKDVVYNCNYAELHAYSKVYVYLGKLKEEL